MKAAPIGGLPWNENLPTHESEKRSGERFGECLMLRVSDLLS